MARSRVRPTLISYNLALGACAKGKGRGGDAAMDILLEVQRKRMRPDVVTYSSVIAALSKGGDWQRVMGLLGAMEESELEPNSFSFSAAITACERAGEWEKALALFEGLHAAGGAVDASVYHAAVRVSVRRRARKESDPPPTPPPSTSRTRPSRCARNSVTLPSDIGRELCWCRPGSLSHAADGRGGHTP